MKKIEIDSQGVTMVNDNFEYDITWDRLQNERDLLAWVFHLSEKTWMTKDDLAFFIEMVATARNFRINTP